MGKKSKLDLDEIKIQSFVTSLDDEEAKRIKGGKSDPYSGCAMCETESGGDDDCCITSYLCNTIGEECTDQGCNTLWQSEPCC